MARKLRIGIIFGGRSAEHEVSLVSAASVAAALDPKKYEIVPIGITPQGRWLSAPDAIRLLKSGRSLAGRPEDLITPDPAQRGLVRVGAHGSAERIDVVFPVLHGSFGEDGTVQGLFELAGIPYVGAGVLGSSVGMDKVVTKQLCEQAGVPVAPYLWFLSGEYRRRAGQLTREIERRLGYPCFVKPANSGSSVGISKAHDRKELLAAIRLAMRFDRKILVEEGIEGAREIEVSVLGNDEPEASVPGEILSSNEFYDYDAKYVDGKSKAVIPAKLPGKQIREVRRLALRAFKAVDCAGMGRVDFLVTKRAVIFNEINTIPGFTSISMYPKLWEASGLSYRKLLDRLIALAVERHKARGKLSTRFRPKKAWYR